MKVSTTTSADSAVMGIYLPEYPSFRRAGSNDKTYGQVVSLTTDDYYTYIWQFNERSVTLLSMTLDKLNVSKQRQYDSALDHDVECGVQQRHGYRHQRQMSPIR